MKLGYLVFENAQAFEGERERFGVETDALGELAFTTGMTGYVETLTNPSYAGRIVAQTHRSLPPRLFYAVPYRFQGGPAAQTQGQ